MARGLDTTIGNLLATQDNVIAHWQVDERTLRLLRRMRSREHARRVSWSVYLLSAAAPTANQLMWAAHLHSGADSMIAGRNALGLSGWDDTQKTPIHVLVPSPRQPRGNPTWLRVHRRTSLPANSLGTLPRVPPHLAAVQACAWANSEREALFVLTSAMQQGIITAARLAEEVARHPTVHRRQLVAEIACEYASGMQSLNELDFTRLCRRYGIPEPRRQTRRLDSAGKWRYTDAEFRLPNGRVLIVEIDGLHHLDPLNWLEDIKRQNNLMVVSDGLLLRVATWTLQRDPDDFMPFLARVVRGEPVNIR